MSELYDIKSQVPDLLRRARKVKRAEEIVLEKRELNRRLSRLRDRISDKEDELSEYRRVTRNAKPEYEDFQDEAITIARRARSARDNE